MSLFGGTSISPQLQSVLLTDGTAGGFTVSKRLKFFIPYI